MVGILINDKHSYFDYGLILSSKFISAPSVKSASVEISGADGVLDLTDYFGEPKFNNRELIFNFLKVYLNNLEFVNDWSKIQNELNGQKVKITLDEDNEFYYYGRISIEYTKEKNIVTITMTVDAEPYKLKRDFTTVEQTGSGTVALQNLRKRVVPAVITTAETKLTFGTTVFNLSAGAWVLPELELSAGENTVEIETTGTVKFEYQEGGL